MIRACRPHDLLALVRLYQECFAEPPWYEVFEEHDLLQEVQAFLAWPDTVMLVAEEEGIIIGGTIGFAVERKEEVVKAISPEWHGAFYLAELFVTKNKRRTGVAKQLLRARFEIAKQLGYTRAVVRTSVDQHVIQHVYAQLGYTLIARQEVISSKIIEDAAQERSDQRIILGGQML